MKSYSLPAKHYAASWKIDSEDHLSTADLTDLGCRYAQACGQEKEDLLLEICQNFHSYLMKYLAMICRGHVPVWKNRINSDSAAFLKYFLPKGSKLNGDSARLLVRSFHLAFKGMDSGEVYDILMEQFLDAVAKYDPEYTEKVKLVVECMNHELSTYKQVRTCDIERHLDIDSNRYLRLLCRRGFLASLKGKDGKISGWVRSGQWPPPAAFFQSGAIGFAYYLQTWFRYYLQQWIEKWHPETDSKNPFDFPSQRREIINPPSLRIHLEDGTFFRSPHDQMVDLCCLQTPHPPTFISFINTKDTNAMNELNHNLPLTTLIRRRRNTLRLKQQQIADVLRVGPEAVGHWERGKRRIELDKLPRLAAVLQLNAQDVCRVALREFHPALYLALFGADQPPEPQSI